MKRTNWTAYAAVALIPIAVYLRTLTFPFVFDDEHLIVNNVFLREPWSPVRAFAHHFWHGTPYPPAYYRPIVIASLALNGRIFGWGPGGFHLVNVLLHAANSALLFLLARRLAIPGWAASVAAVFFAVHPAAAWAVGSIVSRVDLLPALFVLLAWIVLTPAPDVARPRVRAVVVAALYFCALLSKESAVAFFMVPLLALRQMKGTQAASVPAGAPASSAPPEPALGRRGWHALGACFLALLTWVLIRRLMGLGLAVPRRLIDPNTNPLGRLVASDRVPAALALTGRYLFYLIFPLRFADSRNYLDASSLPVLADPGTLLSVLALVTWSLVGFALWWRRDLLGVALGFALAAFLPASNLLVPIASLYALNFLYLPLVGLSLVLGDLLGRVRLAHPVVRPVPAREGGTGGAEIILTIPWPIWIAAPILALLAVASFFEASIWRNSVTLFTSWTERFPFYALAHSGLGVALLVRGDPEAAIAPLRRAVEISDWSIEGHVNLGVALGLTGRDRNTLEEALRHTRRALELVPDAVQARTNASRLLLLLDQPAEAESEARAGLGVAPDDPALRWNLAEAIYRQSRYGEATAVFASLAEQYPRDPNLRSEFVGALIQSSQPARARLEAERARQDFPALAWFDFCLARIEARDGHPEKALALLRVSLARDVATRDWIRQVNDFDAYRGKPVFDAMLEPGATPGRG